MSVFSLPLLDELPDKLATGDPITIEIAGELLFSGKVHLASDNGRALLLLIDGHTGMMPVFRQDDGSYADLLTRAPMTLTRKTQLQ